MNVFLSNNLGKSTVISESWQMLVTFALFVVASFVFSTLKKIVYRIRYKKRYYIFPRTGVKGITNIAMVISIAIAAIILLTVVSAGFMGVLFRAYPGWRVTIEGILIKIGGLLFGPIIGLFVGATTDILSVALTAGMFHYGYFFGAMAYGFFSGLIRTIINLTKNKQAPLTLCLLLISGVVMAVMLGFIWTMQFPDEKDFLVITILGLDISIYKWTLYMLVSISFAFWICVIIICLFIYDKPMIDKWFLGLWYMIRYQVPMRNTRNQLLFSKNKELIVKKHMLWISKHNEDRQELLQKIQNKRKLVQTVNDINWFSYFVPVVTTVLVSESIVEVLMMPFFDQTFSSFPYEHWFVIRTILFLIMSFMNTLVIYPVYRIVSPSMKYNYTHDTVESVSTPLMNN